MGPLVAAGAISVLAEKLGNLDRKLDDLCDRYKFPEGEEFKWSPNRRSWMHSALVGPRRQKFFERVLEILGEHGALATVAVEDLWYGRATKAPSHELDVVTLLLERIEQQCGRASCQGVVVVDRPSGGRAQEDKFSGECLRIAEVGTSYVKPTRIAHAIISADSKRSRVLQAADLVTSCTLALVAGEDTYAPPVFEHIKPLLDQRDGRISGYGLKIHPHTSYANLYHWLLGEDHFHYWQMRLKLPTKRFPYATSPHAL
jgi:hypothetical protein